MVWQRFAKSPRSARAGSSPVASANRLRIAGLKNADYLPIREATSAIRIPQSAIEGPVAQGN